MAENKSLNLNQTRFLQPLRSNTVHTSYTDAIEDIAAIQNSLSTTTHSDGISVVARYTDEKGVGKSVLGIYSQVTDSFTYFVHDVYAIEKIIERVGSLETSVGEGGSVATQITDAITKAIGDLDVATIGGEGKIITSVSEADGKISAEFIDATASNIAVKDDSNLFEATNVEGVLSEIGTALNQEISARTDADSALNGRLDVIEGEGEGSINKAVADAKSELLGEVEADDATTIAGLNDKIQAVEGAAKSYSIVAVTGVGANVKEAWQLQETIGTASPTLVGETIKIYKDSSLKSVELVEEKPVEGKEPEKGQFLKFTYITSEGKDDIVYLNVSSFLAETEFKDGLQVNESGEVSVKIDTTSEGFLTVGRDGIKLSGVQDAIDAAKAAAQGAGETAAANALQDAKDYTNEKIGALDSNLVQEEGKAIVGVSQTDGIISAVCGDIAASHVTVSEISGISATTVQGALAELEGEIAALDAAAVKSIEVNGVASSQEEGVASVTIEGDNIVVSSDNYGEPVVYPEISDTAVTFISVSGSDTVSAAIRTLDQNIATLVQEVLKDEEVNAAAITEIKQSVGLSENLKYVKNTEAAYISGAETLSEADSLLDAAIEAEVSAREQADGELQTAINNVKNAAISVAAGNGISVSGDGTEKTIAAVAKANDSLIEVTESGIGIKDNGYIDCGTF